MANWFVYSGHGDPYLPGNYNRARITPNCSTGCKICAIYLNDNSNTYPASIALVEDYIANALVSLVAQPVGAGVIPFVFLRSC